MIATIIGNEKLEKIESVIDKKWPDCTGVNILTSTVYSACKGVVIFVGCDMAGKYTVTVQIDSKQSIRYCNLSTESVTPNQLVEEGTEIGTVSKSVLVEYCTTEVEDTNDAEESTESDEENKYEPPTTEEGREAIYVRIGSVTYYKHNPYPLLSGEQELTIHGVSSYDLVSSSQLKDPTQLINIESITPFIATLSESISEIDAKKLKKLGVVGIMLYGGALYDSVHIENSQYRSSSLSKQVKLVEDAAFPYGLYVYVRARSIAEAKKECQQLFYIISKYPPKLGLWLKLDLVKNKTINDSILDVYVKELESWGLEGQCGLYATEKQLSKISWDKFQDSFYLWLIKSVDNIDVIETLLTPDFFKH